MYKTHQNELTYMYKKIVKKSRRYLEVKLLFPKLKKKYKFPKYNYKNFLDHKKWRECF